MFFFGGCVSLASVRGSPRPRIIVVVVVVVFPAAGDDRDDDEDGPS